MSELTPDMHKYYQRQNCKSECLKEYIKFLSNTKTNNDLLAGLNLLREEIKLLNCERKCDRKCNPG